MIIQPPMVRRAAPEPGAVWVGELDAPTYLTLPASEAVHLEGAKEYTSAKLLLREGRRTAGFLTTALVDGCLPADFRQQVAAAASGAPLTTPLDTAPTFTVAICTRERPEDLFEALQSVTALAYPNYEIIVVDNAPATSRTGDMLAKHYPQVKHVVEPRKGLSHARNTAVARASGQYIAFTDDDVVVDRWWLQALLAGFEQAPDIACVTGLVPSGELATKSQRYFDSRVTWSRNTAARVYRLGEQYADLPAFPFSVGAYGTGANFAVRRAHALNFDVALGAGRATGGGEDIDFFFRLLLRKQALAVTPDALVWHRHRSAEEALVAQAATYGTGLGAWLTKVALTPRAWALLMPRLISGLKLAGNLGGAAPARAEQAPLDPHLNAQVRATEKAAILRGPALYFKELLRGSAA